MESNLKECIIVINDKTTPDLSKLTPTKFSSNDIKRLCYYKHSNNSDREESFKLKFAKDPVQVHYFVPEIQSYIKSVKPFDDNSNLNPLFQSVYLAYTHHIPLILSPDHIWLTIIQGLSQHIKHNPDPFSKIVNETKMDLKLLRKDFIYKSHTNDWVNGISDINKQMKSKIEQDYFKNCSHKFSTTSKIETVSYNIAILDSLQKYYKFELDEGCTLTKVKLLGVLNDWLIIKQKVENLKKYHIFWWIEHLLPILDKFIKAFEGEEDKIFWNSIIKRVEPARSETKNYADGWILNLFPYVYDEYNDTYKKNPALRKIEEFLNFDDQIKESNVLKEDVISLLPDGLNSIPFKFIDLGNNRMEYDMRLSSGFMGCQLEGEFIKPVIGCCVTEIDYEI